jgi:hypothetical protein
MITLKTPIAQAQKKISPSPLWEELSDESAASCGGGNNRSMVLSVGGKYLVYYPVPASWSEQDAYKYVSHIVRPGVQPGTPSVHFLGIIRS